MSPPKVLLVHSTRRTAVRSPRARTWHLVEGVAEVPPLGVLAALEVELPQGPQQERGLPARWPLLRLPRPPRPLLGAVAAGLFVALLVGPRPYPPLTAHLHDLGDLLAALVGALGTWWLLGLWEALVLAPELRGEGWFRLHPTGPRVERVAWRLLPPIRAPLLLLGVELAAVVGGYQVAARTPMAVGIAAAALIRLLLDLLPLRPGAGTRLLERALGIPDLAGRLPWTIRLRFLPLPTPTDSGGTLRLAVATAAVGAWFALAAWSLQHLGQAPKDGLTMAGTIWRVGMSGLGLGYVAWLVVRLGRWLGESLRLGRQRPREIEPPSELLELWRRCSLLRHVPELAELPWRWLYAPPGTLLIRYGERDRVFYWVADGQIDVVGRTPEGDPILLAALGGGTGVGEIAFLEGRPRTADVVVRQAAIVAALDWQEAQPRMQPEALHRFRDVVLASQALGRSATFRGMPAPTRERWIAAGTPVHYQAGETILEYGERSRWLGLIVSGQVEVTRDEVVLARLGPDHVLGEMAYLSGDPRSATVRALEPTLLWRWEPEWLDEELGSSGVRHLLEALARRRKEAP